MNRKYTLFSTCAFVQGKIFSFTNFTRIPFLLDIHTGEICLQEGLYNYDPSFETNNMISNGDFVYALELNGKRMMKYNVSDKTCDYIPIFCDRADWGNYAAFAKYGKYLYIFPTYGNDLIKIDSETDRLQRLKNLYAKIKTYKTEEEQKNKIVFECGCQLESKMWLFEKQGDIAVSYDMKDDVWEEHKLSLKVNNCIHAATDKEKIYLLSSGGEVFVWNLRNKQLEKIGVCSNNTASDNAFVRIVVTREKIFLLPFLENEIFCMELKNKKMERLESYPLGFQYCAPENWSKYYGYCEDHNKYYFAMRSMNFILTLDKRDGEVKWISPRVPSDEIYTKVYFKYNKTLLKENQFSISQMLSCFKGDMLQNSKENFIMTGDQIWKQLKRN